ncbi:MAG: MarR family transcriptional regulator [Chloroflexota bacterium]
MDKLQQYVEEFGMYFERIGLPRMMGRIIGYLLISEPAQQSMQEIGAALQASKSSVSIALKALVSLKLIDQVSIPGERRDYYRANADMWIRSFRARMSQMTDLRELAERGLELMADETPERRRRLENMHATNRFLETEFPKLLDRWDDEKQSRGYDDH